ncbi:hypothetical protein BBO_04193 [Beauveria brongniartii RCEF 3172]|uniref:Uncharacterized protein n=1 Tax=Beauveria brongniartii RCEF 3172 TaxID=1081107 RepID=A0A162LU32_9HYPO|nr:hypothetical protein BBO_04193 [Beauveria brongniartii RCEF 3172]
MTNCTNAPPQAPSEPGVAGAGVCSFFHIFQRIKEEEREWKSNQILVTTLQILLSFIITAGLALMLSASVILTEIRGRPSAVRRKLLNGFSDSQIVQGIGIQSVALAKMGSLVPYHFFLVWMLSLLSMATHNATLLALVADYRRDWVLRWLRQLLMFVNLTLSSVSGVFVLQVVSRGMSFSTLPVACIWDNGGDAASTTALGKPPPGADGALSYVGTVAVLAGNLIIFGLATWYLHSRQQRWYKMVQVAGLLVMVAVAIGATVRVVLLSSAFGKPSVTLADEDEKSWSFGQLLSMLLLVLPLISAVEIYRGDVQMAPPAEDADRLLYDGELQSRPGNRFQPNPFFGSETNSFKK